MTKKLETSMMGELTYFLILQVKQDDKRIFICQERYTRNLLKKYEIFDSSSVKTPMVPPNNLSPDLAGKPVNETSYRGMIGSLMYLTATRPNIQFFTVLCFDLKGYSDSDYAGCNMDRRRTSAEAEYVATAGCCASILWMKRQLSDYDIYYKMSRMLLYIKGKKIGRMMLESIESGPLVYPTIEENGHIRNKKYVELTEQDKLQDNCNVQAINIVLQGLPPDVYSLVNHCQSAKDIWDRVKLLMQGIELSYQERKCKVYNEFDKFTSIKGESLHEYYLCFAQLVNDMHTIGITIQQVQVNTKFLNALQPEWSKFVTDVKLAKNMYNTNFDQLYAYLSQHEGYANEVRMMRERYPDPLALAANYQPHSRGNNAAGQARVVKCYNCQGEGHMARQCTKPKRLRNSAWFKEKILLTTIPQNAAFQTNDIDAYDSDCDDISSAKAMSEQISNQVTHWDKVNQETKIVNESLTVELERYKERVKIFEQRLNVNLSSREKRINSQIDDMIQNRNAFKQEIDSLK
ncbi:integrase, catalytic region, zinc finger, CCHC-type containing protein [Tanacetum coccineum]